MAMRFDPQDVEAKALKRYAGDFNGKSVLEIGSGSGRLTWLYADEASRVLAIDPKADKIAVARNETPAHLVNRVAFEQVGLEAFRTDERFDLVILPWSL